MSKKSMRIFGVSLLLIFFLLIGNVCATGENVTDLNLISNDDLLNEEISLDENINDVCDNEILFSDEQNIDFTSNVSKGSNSISVKFEATSKKDNINSWSWNFGDGSTSDEQNPTHIYSKIGLYNVTLTAVDSNGIFENITKNNYINVFYEGNPFINPDFEEGTINSPANVYGWNLSAINIYGSSSEQYPSDFKIVAGNTDEESLKALSYNGNILRCDLHSDFILSFGQYINFDSINEINFKFLPNLDEIKSRTKILNITVLIDDTPIKSVEDKILGTEWSNFNINTTEYQGTHFVQIKIYRPYYVVWFENFTVTYNDKVSSNFNYDDNIDGNNINVQFINQATGLINYIFWDFGDGTNSSDINPNHSFAPGNYKVTLTVSNENNTADYTYNLNLNYPTIDGKMYATVQDAINDAESGAEINIPIDLSENLIVNQTVTLNFNGNKLTSSNSPLISIINGADVTVNNISLSGDSNVFATDETSKLTIKDSTISDTKLELQSGNITVQDISLNNAQLTINANTTLTNVNAVNSGIIVSGGKSKITKSAFTGSDVAIAQTGGELELTNNIIKDNNVALNITTGSATISLNAIYNNTSVNINDTATVTNNWFGTNQVTGFESYLRLVITATVSEMYPGKEYTITAELVPNTGSLEGSIDNLTLEFTSPNGETTPVTINNNNGEFKFTTGQITDEVTLKLFNEDYTLVNGENPVSIVTEPLDTNITITSPENGVVVIRLSTAEGNVSGENVSYTINGGNKVNNVTDANGQIIIKDLTGKVTINATYDGNKTLNPSAANKVFDFTIATVITAANVSTTYGAAKELIITLTANGNALANKTINVTVGTINKNLTTNASGQVSVDVSGLNPNSYVATIAFAGDEVYAKSNANASVVINKVDSSLSAPAVSTMYNVAKDLVITLTANGKALNGQKVTVKVGTISKTLTTNAKGQVSVAISSLVPKTYQATISFAGDKIYTASSTTAKVVVVKAKSKITAKKATFKAKKKTKKYTITLKAGKKAISKVKVTLKVKGKTYKAKTNAKGKATFKINKLTKKGKHTATIKFAGNKYYKASTKKVKLTVKK